MHAAQALTISSLNQVEVPPFLRSFHFGLASPEARAMRSMRGASLPVAQASLRTR